MSRLVAILGGGDWADASVTHLVLPEGMDVEAERGAYREWDYGRWFRGERKRDKETEPWMSFSDWLVRRGAREATENDILIVED